MTELKSVILLKLKLAKYEMTPQIQMEIPRKTRYYYFVTDASFHIMFFYLA